MADEESAAQASVTMDENGVAAKDRKVGSVATSGTRSDDDSHASTEMVTTTMTPQRITPEQSLAALNDTSRQSEGDNDTDGEPAKPKRTPRSLFSEGNNDDESENENDPKSKDASTSTLVLCKHESIMRKRPRHYVADDPFVTHEKLSHVDVALQFTQDSFETAEPEHFQGKPGSLLFWQPYFHHLPID
jgi:hypothetical protein